MEYLIINGSPHRGNTWKLVELVKENIKTVMSEATFEEVDLFSLDLPPCDGCSDCLIKGNEHCPHSGVISDIVEKMDKADAVIFAASTYYLAPNALAKNFIDHLSYLLHRPQFFTKKALVITTSAMVGEKETAKYLSVFMKNIGFNKCYTIALPVFSYNGYKVNDDSRKVCYDTARAFHADAVSGKLSPPSFSVLVNYNTLRGFNANTDKTPSTMNADEAYWSHFTRAKDAYDAKIPTNLFHKLFGLIVYNIKRAQAEKNKITYIK